MTDVVEDLGVAAEFDQLRRDVASWCAAALPCLGCGHLPGQHDRDHGVCWGRPWDEPAGACLCQRVVTSADRSADRAGVRTNPNKENP